MSKKNQKLNPRGFVDRFYNTTLNQTPELSSKLIPKQENLINKTQDSLKQVLTNRKSLYREKFENNRPTPLFLTNKRNPI